MDLDDIFALSVPKKVLIRDRTLGFINYGLLLLLFTCAVCYSIVYKCDHLEHGPVNALAGVGVGRSENESAPFSKGPLDLPDKEPFPNSMGLETKVWAPIQILFEKNGSEHWERYNTQHFRFALWLNKFPTDDHTVSFGDHGKLGSNSSRLDCSLSPALQERVTKLDWWAKSGWSGVNTVGHLADLAGSCDNPFGWQGQDLLWTGGYASKIEIKLHWSNEQAFDVLGFAKQSCQAHIHCSTLNPGVGEQFSWTRTSIERQWGSDEYIRKTEYGIWIVQKTTGSRRIFSITKLLTLLAGYSVLFTAVHTFVMMLAQHVLPQKKRYNKLITQKSEDFHHERGAKVAEGGEAILEPDEGDELSRKVAKLERRVAALDAIEV